jgi:hypothetical protein
VIEAAGDPEAQIHFLSTHAMPTSLSACQQLNKMSTCGQIHMMSMLTIALERLRPVLNRQKTSYWCRKMLFHVKQNAFGTGVSFEGATGSNSHRAFECRSHAQTIKKAAHFLAALF